MDAWLYWVIGAGCWLAFALVANLLMRGPRPDPATGLAYQTINIYARWFHRLKVTGLENVPTMDGLSGRPLIIVANHVSGVDPVLVQAGLPKLFVRWAMGADMRVAAMDPIWKFLRTIFVDRSGKADPNALREMLEHLESGGVLGVFPEGKLRQPGTPLGEFQAGVGLLARRSKAVILPAVLTGVPQTYEAWDALKMRSHSRLEFKPLVIPEAGASAAQIASDLRTRYLGWLKEPHEQHVAKTSEGRAAARAAAGAERAEGAAAGHPN